MATTTASGTPKSKATVVIASLMLFSMFFGAGTRERVESTDRKIGQGGKDDAEDRAAICA